MNEYKSRRDKLIEAMPKNSIAVLFGANGNIRNGDTEFPFRQNSDFLYLTGFDEPNAIAIIESGKNSGFTIFCQEKDPNREQWEGKRMGPNNFKEIGALNGFSINSFNEEIDNFLLNKERVYCHKNSNSSNEKILNQKINELKKASARTNNSVPEEMHSVESILHEMRLIKSDNEINLIKDACKISASAHKRAMQRVRPEIYEYQLEAEYIHEFMINGSRASAYPSIVGGGKNACILHYSENSEILKDGDLVLVDAGCEYKGYASDITRTFPINGKFSKSQEAIYEIVLEANKQCIKTVKIGSKPSDTENVAIRVITQGLIDLKLLSGDLNELIEKKLYSDFYMHRVGHWMGLDVHDVGNYGTKGVWREYEPGMITTIEPGIYIKEDLKGLPDEYLNIGIRIEDDVLVTNKEPEILTSDVPKEIKEIETLMSA